MSARSRSRVLSLYRSILRTAREWTGPTEEQQYIRNEAKTVFRANRGTSDAQQIKEQIEEAESRLDIGVHYRIPYPRLHHNKPFKYTEPPAGSFGGRDPEAARKLAEQLRSKAGSPGAGSPQ